jgi:hypothetical protein
MLQQSDHDRTIWSTNACLLELLCLLPVMVSRQDMHIMSDIRNMSNYDRT